MPEEKSAEEMLLEIAEGNLEAMEFLKDKLKFTNTNEEFLISMNG